MSRVTIIDFSYMYFRYIYGKKEAIGEDPNHLMHSLGEGMIEMINKFRICKDNPLYLAIDCKRKNNWRHDAFERMKKNIPIYQGLTYKGNRTTDESIDWETMEEKKNIFIKTLAYHTDVKVIYHPNAEADDVIYMATELFDDVTIISADKDFKQLLRENVRIYDPRQKKYLSIDMPPDDFLKLHICLGDKIDGILNIKKGWGPKTILKNLKDLDVFLSNDDDMKDRYNFNKILIDLKELPLDIRDDIERLFNIPQNGYDYGKMFEYCKKYRMRTLFHGLDNFNFLQS